MEITALCIRLLMDLLMLLVAHVQQSYPQTSVSGAALRIVPNQLQLFEYSSVSFTCEWFNVSAGCRVRNIKEFVKKCSNGTATSAVTCTIDFAFVSDSGEYWCGGEGGERSNTVNITVTGGSVILESPVLPVMEGNAVTLRCRNRENLSNITADFYKDGVLIGTSSTGNMTIESVSKSDEGLYKCNISGAGESPESRLAVRVGPLILESPVLPVTEGSNVTLRCGKKTTSSDLTADFYKNGLFMGSSSTGEMIIHSVSKSDEGLYKCSISDNEESAESWLAVRALCRETCRSSDHFFYVLLLLRTVSTVVMVALLLLLVGLLHCGKLTVTPK